MASTEEQCQLSYIDQWSVLFTWSSFCNECFYTCEKYVLLSPFHLKHSLKHIQTRRLNCGKSPNATGASPTVAGTCATSPVRPSPASGHTVGKRSSFPTWPPWSWWWRRRRAESTPTRTPTTSTASRSTRTRSTICPPTTCVSTCGTLRPPTRVSVRRIFTVLHCCLLFKYFCYGSLNNFRIIVGKLCGTNAYYSI